MSTVSKRQKSRRRLAAYSFLSNISLDGTHRDTKIGFYNLSLQAEIVKCNVAVKTVDSTKQPVNNALEQNECLNRNSVSDEKLQFCSNRNVASTTSPRERVHSFVSETKSKFLRKKTVQELVPAPFTSAENLGLCSRHTSSTLSDTSLEVRFCKSLRDVNNERIILLSNHRVPYIVFSRLPYVKPTNSKSDFKQDANRRRQASGNRPLSSNNDNCSPTNLLSALGYKASDGQEVSYRCLLASIPRNAQMRSRFHDGDYLSVPHMHISRCHSFDPVASNLHCTKQPNSPPFHYDKGFDWSNSKLCHQTCLLTYTPNLLDDPELVVGKHNTVLTFSSYITSIIDYVKPSDLKKEINEKFKERFPQIHLTLSKLRSLKKEMLKITHHECGIDLLTVAQAYVFFEKLILKMLINKHNRKPCAAACLLLSAKLNDVKGHELKNFIERMESGFRLNHKDLISCEFGVLVALEFALHLPMWEIYPHYQRLLYET